MAAGSERALIRDAGFADADVGYAVVDLADGGLLRAHQADKAFVPASMTKIATALAALERLGPGHRFRTAILAHKEAEGLHLHLTGGGDPVLVQEDLAALADALRGRLAGRPVTRFTFDDAALPFIAQIDPSDDGLKPYNPPVSALSVNFNRQWLRWSREERTRVMRVRLLPDVGDAMAGMLGRAPPDGRAIMALEAGRMLYLLTPVVPSKGHRQTAVRAPALRTAAILRHYAARSGLLLPAPEALPAIPARADTFAVHESRPLLAIAEDLLEFSNNLSAELIGLATGQAMQADIRTLAESAAAVRDWLAGTLPAAFSAGWQMPNQSGLSGRARATPAALMALLRYAAGRSYALPASTDKAQTAGPIPFLSLLREPSWGKDRQEIEIHSKSGTMYYARGQAGVLTARSGRRLLFVLMHTDFEARAAYEAHPARYTDAVQKAARVWLSRARRVEKDILLHWVATL